MKAIKTIRTYAPKTLSTSEAKEMISKSLFTRKMAFKVAGKRTSKAEFERSAEGTTTQIIMTKKLNLYCMGNGNEETRFHLTFNVVIIPTEEVATEEAEEIEIEIEDTVNEIIRSAKASETNIEAYFNGNPDNAAVIFIKQLANKQAKKPIDYFTEQQLKDSYRVSEELYDLIENEPFKAYRKIVTTQSIHFQYAVIEGRIPKPEIHTTETNKQITRKALRRLIHQLTN